MKTLKFIFTIACTSIFASDALENRVTKDKINTPPQKALVPKEIYVSNAWENAVVCVHFRIDKSFDGCKIRHPHLTLHYAFAHKHFEVVYGQLQLKNISLCRPLRQGNKGDFCIEYDRNKIPDSSKVAFKKMFISTLVLECTDAIYKLRNEKISLGTIIPTTQNLNKKKINGCPNTQCYKWRKYNHKCRPRTVQSIIPIENFKMPQHVESVLLIAVVLLAGAIIAAIVQISK